jgi:hypothetical protein
MVENQFHNHEIFAGHRYFTGGTLEDPRAILVLKPQYQLDAPDWRPVTMTPEELAQWVEALKKDSFVEYNTFSNGAKIIDDNGNLAGYYYSVWEFPLVRMPGEKTIQLAVPATKYRSTNRRVEFFISDNPRENH